MYEKFPEKQADRTDREIAYYQWVPLLLALQMLACWLPRIFFKAMNFSAGEFFDGNFKKSKVPNISRLFNGEVGSSSVEHQEGQGGV